MQVKELVSDIKRLLANREDIEDKAPYWIRNSVWELTDSVPFTELEIFGPEKQLTVGEASYSLTDFVNPGDKISFVECFEILLDYPTNSISRAMKFKEIMALKPLSRLPGLPVWWSRFGDKFVVANKPDKAYTVTMLYQRKHPFNMQDLGALKEQELLVPDSWLEIVAFSSALRAAMELRLADYVTLYHAILHGDPENPSQPGLIKARLTQHQRDKMQNEGQITPVVGRYSV